MSKLVQILLTKALVVNLGRDDQGEAKTVQLNAGLQEVEQEIAEHWFVKANAQDIAAADSNSQELQTALDAANAELQALKTQAAAADIKSDELIKAAAANAKEIADLKEQLAEAQQLSEANSKAK